VLLTPSSRLSHPLIVRSGREWRSRHRARFHG